MDSYDMKWKSRLLSSSVPLEITAASILATHGFHSKLDYEVPTEDGVKSSDILAWTAVGRPEEEFEFYVVVECKYRAPGNVVLLFPKPVTANEIAGQSRPLYPSDRFTFEHVGKQRLHEFNGAFSLASKGVEIDTNQGNVDDQKFRDGMRQLLLASSRVDAEMINQSLNSRARSPWVLDRQVRRMSTSVSKIAERLNDREFTERYLKDLGELQQFNRTHSRVGFLGMWNSIRKMLLMGSRWKSLVEVHGDRYEIDHEVKRPYFILPILVTNADLWLVQKDKGLDDFIHMRELESVADSVDRVSMAFSPDAEASNTYRSVVKSETGESRAKLAQLERAWRSDWNGAKRAAPVMEDIRQGAHSYQGHALVCKIESLSKTLGEALSLIDLLGEETRVVRGAVGRDLQH